MRLFFNVLIVMNFLSIVVNAQPIKPIPANLNVSPDSKTLQLDPDAGKIPVFLINDVIPTHKMMVELSADDVAEIVIVKSKADSLSQKYGPQAKVGVIFIYTQDFLANKWYKRFASQNKKIALLIQSPGFNYRSYKVILNGKPLDNESLGVDLDSSIKKEKIKKIAFGRRNNHHKNIKGVIRLRT